MDGRRSAVVTTAGAGTAPVKSYTNDYPIQGRPAYPTQGRPAYPTRGRPAYPIQDRPAHGTTSSRSTSSWSTSSPVIYVVPESVARAAGQAPAQTYTAYIALAATATVCCGLLFGGLALLFAVLASNYSSHGEATRARRMARVSLGPSIAGIALGAAAIGIILGITFGLAQPQSTYVIRVPV